MQSDGTWKYPSDTAVLYRRFKVGGQYPARQFEHVVSISHKKADRNGKFLSAFGNFLFKSIQSGQLLIRFLVFHYGQSFLRNGIYMCIANNRKGHPNEDFSRQNPPDEYR